MLTVKDLHKSYQVGDSTYEVLKGIDLDVAKGEFVGVMGPSGSGKTTMQRTAVARALINQPKMILADEPTGNLDSKSSRAVIDSFMQAKEALEATILMVTHDSYAASFCDRVVILRDGVVWKVLSRGTTDRIHFQDALLEAIGAMGKE